MLRRAPKPTPTDTLSPYTTLFRSTHPTRARDVRTFTESGARQRCTIRRTRAHRTHSYGPDGLGLLVHLDSDAHQYTRSPGHGGMGSAGRSEEHTSELQSLMAISYAVLCLKNQHTQIDTETP